MRLEKFAGAVLISAQRHVRNVPADGIENICEGAAQIVDRANGKERIDRTEQVQPILEVAEHHSQAASHPRSCQNDLSRVAVK